MTDIEKAAEAMWQEESIRARGAKRLIPWAEEHPSIQEQWRGLARAALDAARGESADERQAAHTGRRRGRDGET